MSKIKLVALVAALVLVLPAALVAGPQAGDIVFTVGQAAYQYDGETIPMSAAPVIIDGRTYLPVRDVAQALGLGVSWNPANRSITINPSPGATVSGSILPTIDGGYDLPVIVSIGRGTKMTAMLDTGATISVFPDDYLRKLGYSPIPGAINVHYAAGVMNAFVYKVPYPTIWQEGKAIPLGSGYVTVIGIVGGKSVFIGCNILAYDNLIIHSGNWSLTIPTN